MAKMACLALYCFQTKQKSWSWRGFICNEVLELSKVCGAWSIKMISWEVMEHQNLQFTTKQTSSRSFNSLLTSSFKVSDPEYDTSTSHLSIPYHTSCNDSLKEEKWGLNFVSFVLNVWFCCLVRFFTLFFKMTAKLSQMSTILLCN